MSRPAAIAGTFADVKIIRTRSVMQVVVEIPIEQADAALAALGGVPQPGSERPVAIARIDPAATRPAPDQDRANWAALPAAKQAGIRCGDVRFQKWIGAESEDAAAALLRQRLGIQSRSELATAEHQRRWAAVDRDYRAWLETQGREQYL